MEFFDAQCPGRKGQCSQTRADAGRYVDTIMRNLHWGRISQRYEAATSRRSPLPPTAGVTAEEVLADRTAMLLVDVRLPDDYAASGIRMPDVAWHDPGRKIVVVQRYHDTFHFNPKTTAWKKVLTGNADDGRSPYGHDARSVFYHDPVSGHGLLVQFQTNTLWSYDPGATTWTKLTPEGDAMPTGNKRLAYIDPAADRKSTRLNSSHRT
mgnify:CR=1 FL=1